MPGPMADRCRVGAGCAAGAGARHGAVKGRRAGGLPLPAGEEGRLATLEHPGGAAGQATRGPILVHPHDGEIGRVALDRGRVGARDGEGLGRIY